MRYVVKKYVNASSLEEALKLERQIKPDDIWKDEKQPEETGMKDQIGFNLAANDYYYSPVLKRKGRKKKKQ